MDVHYRKNVKMEGKTIFKLLPTSLYLPHDRQAFFPILAALSENFSWEAKHLAIVCTSFNM
jgi:hypothetical protein